MNLKERRAAAMKALEELIEGAEKDDLGNPILSKDNQNDVDTRFKEVEELDDQITDAENGAATADRLKGLAVGQKGGGDAAERPANSLGEHVVKSIGDNGFSRLKTMSNTVVATPEYAKASTDTQVTGAGGDGGGPFGHWLTDVDETLVRQYRRGPVVADLLGTGSLSGSIVRYFVEGPFEGTFETVGETGQKPQIHMGPPDPRTDSVRKIAAWFDSSDEMIEDLQFYMSEINNRALHELAMIEENQLLNGDGSGNNLLGLLNRSGIQELDAAESDSNPDALFRALTRVQTASGLQADAIVIHPMDYEKIRLSRDSNGQYMGGGYFQGQYGNGGFQGQPPLWGRNTVVTPAVAQGTAVVGALAQAATVYRKGGVRVESTNSDQGKFTTNVVTTRIEERLALAVRRPSAVVKVALQTADTGGEV